MSQPQQVFDKAPISATLKATEGTFLNSLSLQTPAFHNIEKPSALGKKSLSLKV